MNQITRRGFLGLTAAGIGGLALGPAWPMAEISSDPSGGLAALYLQFVNPDRRYSIRPFWFWNGTLEGEELARQIKQMVEHGVFGAYVHNRDGLQTRYLSEAWWQAVGDALQAAREHGFSLCMVDEYEWPSGDAHDAWLPGINKSLVVKANPDFQMHRLRPVETRVRGPQRIHVPLPARPAVVSVGRLVAHARLDGQSLATLPFDPRSKEIAWDAPAGDWIVFTYGLERAIGQPDHGEVESYEPGGCR